MKKHGSAFTTRPWVERQIRERKQMGLIINNVFVSFGFRIRREVEVRGPSGCSYCQRSQRKSRENGNVRGGQINPVLSVPCRRKHAFLLNSISSKDLDGSHLVHTKALLYLSASKLQTRLSLFSLFFPEDLRICRSLR